MKKSILAVWVLCVLVCVMVVKLTAIGPVIWVISLEHGWGVHSGDLIIVVPVIVASLVTVWLLRRNPV